MDVHRYHKHTHAQRQTDKKEKALNVPVFMKTLGCHANCCKPSQPVEVKAFRRIRDPLHI